MSQRHPRPMNITCADNSRHLTKFAHHSRVSRSVQALYTTIASLLLLFSTAGTANSDTAFTQADAVTFAFIADMGSSFTCATLNYNDCQITASIDGGTDTKMQATTLLIDRINAALIKRSLSHWSTAWGPTMQWRKGAISTAPLDYTTAGTMVVFRNGNTDVVAIAGTNPISDYGWLVEDADIINFGDWPNGSPTGEISAGTAEGINLLLTMGGGQSAGTNTTLLYYLRAEATAAATANPPEKIEVIVVGHSLGETLSPVIATTLIDTQQNDMNLAWNFPHVASIDLNLKAWDSNSVATVSTIFFAGATPGNKDFADYANSLMAGTDGMVSVYNHFDVVPRGWDKLGRSWSPASESLVNIYTTNGDYCNKPKKGSACPFTDTTPTSSNPGDVICPCRTTHELIIGAQALAETFFLPATPV